MHFDQWAWRYRPMRLHFAIELVLALICKALENAGKVQKIGAHISDKTHIDFDWPENISPLFPELTAEARAISDANAPIISAFSDEANERRYCEVTWRHAGPAVAHNSNAQGKWAV